MATTSSTSTVGTGTAGSINSLGVGSGLPLSDLLTQLRTNANVALTVIQTQQTAAQTKLSAYGTVQNALEGFQAAAAALTSSDTYGALKTNVSGDALTASTTDGAVAGQYSITVDQLATSQTLVTTGLADRTSSNGTGGSITVTLSDGTTKTLDLSGKSTSLNDVISAINGDPDLGITATMINDGSSTPYHLLLTASDSGTDASVASISSTNESLQSILGFTQGSPSANITETEATNALLHINGIAITSQSNQVDDAIEGVTLSLSQVDSSPTTLSITHDDSATSQAVQNFVNAYNSLQTTIQSLTAYDTSTNTGGALTGDSVARNVQNQIRNVLNTTMPSGTVQSLYQLGITTDPTNGTLSLDSDKLAAAINSNPGDVQNLLGGASGIGTLANNLTTSMLGTGGLLSAATDGMNQTLTDLQNQYTQTSNQIDAQMTVYQQQFTALDTLVAQMNSTSSYLTQQLSQLGSTSSSSSSS